jgi:ElaB/YqjD/DUF883 family membrane-anchored ribosome-binding protein
MANEQNQDKQSEFGVTAGSSESLQNKTSSTTSTTESKTENSSGTAPVEKVKDTAQEIYSQAKDTTGQAYGIAAQKAKSTIEEQKTNLATGLTSVADSIKQVGENLRGAEDNIGITNLTAKYSDSLARQIEQISGYFENKDLREMTRDVERFARRNPAIFIGSAFALGLLAARFLKSSPTGNTSSSRRQNLKSSRTGATNFASGSEQANRVSTTKTSANPS